MTTLRSVLICHAGDDFDQVGLAAWLGSFSQLAGIVVLDETGAQKRARIRREIRRVGPVRFVDVVAMRLYQRLALAARDRSWMDGALASLRSRYGDAPAVPQLIATDVNAKEVAAFLREAQPDIVIARCKQLLRKNSSTCRGLACSCCTREFARNIEMPTAASGPWPNVI